MPKQDRTKAELEKELAIFRLFVEASSQGFGMADLEGNVTYLNPALCRMAGIENADEAVGRHLAELYPEGYDRRWETEIYPTLLATGQWEGEVAGSVGGRPACALQNRFLIRDETGNPARLAVVMTDITRRKQVEEALRVSEERLRLALEAMSDGYWEWDIASDVLYFAPRYRQLLGYAPEEMPKTHQQWQKLIHPDDLEAAAERIRDHLEGRAHTFEMEFRARKKSGEWLWMLGRGKVVRRDAHGQPAAMVGVNIDISERKKAEEAIRTSEERFRSYFAQGLIGMAVSTPETRWAEVNDRLCEILGYSREELLGMKWTEATHPDDVERGLALFRRIAAGEIDDYTTEKRFVRKNGATVYVNLFVRSFRRKDGSVDHFLALIEDVTDRKKAQERLRREYQTLEHLLESSDHERQLIAYELHDGLAQYLAGCIMQFQTYNHLKSRNPEEAAKAYDGAITLLRQAHYESRRLIAGVRPPVLDESGVVEAIAHLVHEVGQNYEPSINFRSNVQFGRLAPTLENAIYRIAQEGLSNACRHSSSDRIEVSLVQRGSRVRILVQDWGVGFDTASVPSGHFGLEGIRQRARLLGGKWSIRSKPGEGTRIAVEVPLLARGPGGVD